MNIIKSLKSASISAKKYSAQLFADAVLNTTGDSDLSPGMKIFYDTALLRNVGSQTYFAQFGNQHKIFDVWHVFAIFPFADSLRRNTDFIGKFFLSYLIIVP